MRNCIIYLLVAIGAFLCASQSANAADPRPVLDWERRNIPGTGLNALSENSFGEQIDPHMGGVGFSVVDVSLPGNFDIPVEIRRTISQGRKYHPTEIAAFSDWELDVPRISFGYLGDAPRSDRCSTKLMDVFKRRSVAIPNGGTYSVTRMEPEDYSAGFSLHMNGGTQELLDRRYTGGSDGDFFPSTATHVTKNDWYFTCITARDGSQGFLGRSPDGKTYRFDHVVTKRAVSPFLDNGDDFRIATNVSLKVTRIEDRFGNYVDYEYFVEGDPNNAFGDDRLHRIRASDGRIIKLQYASAGSTGGGSTEHPYCSVWRQNNVFLASVGMPPLPDTHNCDSPADSGTTSAYDPTRIVVNITSGELLPNSNVIRGARTWRYAYRNLNFQFDSWERDANSQNLTLRTLRKVTQPDNRTWEYEFDDMVAVGSPSDSCNRGAQTFEIKAMNPYGAKLSIKLQEKKHRMSSGKDYGVYNSCTSLLESFTPSNLKRNDVAYVSKVSVVEKNIDVQGLKSKWLYNYEQDKGSSDYSHLSQVNTTTITGPASRRVYEHFWPSLSSNNPNGDGRLARVKTYNVANGALLETRSFEYARERALGFAFADRNFKRSPHATQANMTKLNVIRHYGSAQDSFATTYQYNSSHGSSSYSFGLPTVETLVTNIAGARRITNTQYQHKPGGRWIVGLTKQVDIENRQIMRNEYDTLGRVKSTTKFRHPYRTYTYQDQPSKRGALYEVRDALNRFTRLEDWEAGTPQRITFTDNTSIYQGVDVNGWMTSSKDANGNTTGYSYDKMGRLTLIDPPGSWTNTVFHYSFPSSGGVVQTITKGNARTIGTYDGLLRPTLERAQDLSGNWESYTNTEYDGLGRVTFKSHPSGVATNTAGFEFEYDGLGRAIMQAETVSPFATTTTSYHSSNKKRVTDPEGHYVDYYSDGFGDPIKIFQSLSGSTGVTTEMIRNKWGEMQQLRQHGNQNGHNIDKSQYFTYDDQRRVCRHNKPESFDTLYGYDAAGQMISKAEAIPDTHIGCSPYSGNKLITYEYDYLGRMTLTDYFILETQSRSGTADTYNTYDANGNLLETRRSTGTNSITRIYTYDTLNNLKTEKLSLEGESYYMAYSYDLDGYLTSRTYPSGRVVNYANDGLGRAKTISSGEGDYAFLISYHPSGATESLTYGNGLTYTQTLNDRLLPKRILTYSKSGPVIICKPGAPCPQPSSITALDLTYDYDKRGKVTSMVDGTDTTNDRTYGYDGMGRLTSAVGPWDTGSYVYDSLGNLRSKTLGSRTVTNNYDANKNLITSSDDSVSGTRNVTHNGRGGVNVLGDLEFWITKSNRTKAVLGPNGQIGAYRYDGHYRRVKSDTDGAELYTMYDAAGTLMHRHNKTTGEKTDYVAGPGNTTIRVKHGAGAGIPTYLHKDHLGSASTGTDTSGTILWTEQYTPFGEKHVADTANDNHPGFTGHVFDSATGLTYMQARYYDPGIGRFLSIDPVTFMGSGGNPGYFNRYAYVMNDPVNNNDPTGMACDNPNGYCSGARPVPKFTKKDAGVLADFVPVVGDVKGGKEFLDNPSVLGGVAVVAGIVPIAGDAVSGMLRQADNVGEGATTVYRAVDSTELADIAENGLRLGPNGAEVKAFVGTQDEASALANAYGSDFSVIKADVPQSVMQNAENYNFKDVPGQEMTAIAIRGQEQLNKVCNVGVCE